MRLRIVSNFLAASILMSMSGALAQDKTTSARTTVETIPRTAPDLVGGSLRNHKLLEQQTPKPNMLQGQVTREDFRLPRKQMFADPRAFADNPAPQTQQGTVQTAAPLSGQVAEKAAPRGTYLWVQSLGGGYYDATGQMQQVVPGDQLYKYGGKLQDGSEIPPYPVVTNFAGHVYKPFVRKMAQ